jgi:CHAT domain-containing protein
VRSAAQRLRRAPVELAVDGERRAFDFSDPYHWAGFVLSGAWEPLPVTVAGAARW